jgi:hypothetical protein
VKETHGFEKAKKIAELELQAVAQGREDQETHAHGGGGQG